jgi:hypothetical protein
VSTVWTGAIRLSTLDDKFPTELDNATNELETSVNELDKAVNVVLSSATTAPSEFTVID